MTRALKEKTERATDLDRGLLKRTTLVFLLKILSHALSLLTAIVMARLLGLSGYGIYNYTLTLIGLLSIPATLGLDSLLVREVAIYRTHSAWEYLKGILRWTNLTVLALSLGLAVVAGTIAEVLWGKTHPQTLLPFWIALVSLPLTSLRSLRLATMRGLHRVLQGLWPEDLLAPLLLMALMGSLYLLGASRLAPAWGLCFYVLVSAITFILGAIILNRALPGPLRKAIAQYQVRSWLGSALPLMFLDALRTINNRTDILMLGATVGADGVGIYTAAFRGTQLVTFILMAVNISLAPTVASLYSQGSLAQLQNAVTKTSRLISLVSLLITVLLIAFSHWYLSFFGPEFIQGRNALIFLAVGNFVNAATGSVGVLLNMTGNERYTVITMGVSAILNVMGNFLLIPRWGVDGAAFATASSTIFVNIVKVIWVRQKLGIDSTAFGTNSGKLR